MDRLISQLLQWHFHLTLRGLIQGHGLKSDPVNLLKIENKMIYNNT